MFEKRSAKVSFPEIEQTILAFWEQHKIFEKSVSLREGKPLFTFYDGPPFATGLPHYGHILAGAIKDTIPRYKTMQGFHVPRTNGWDCHGLPVEYEIEKELGISGKPDIEAMGVAEFNQACRGIVFRYTKEWEKTIKRMGRWVDFEDSYATMDRNYMESIWWVIKQIWDKGLMYQDYHSTWYCPRCGTPLSNFEVNQGYKDDVSDPSIFVKFQLDKEPNTFMLAWTTTPWTLPGNAALAINPALEYVKVKLKDGMGLDGRALNKQETESVGQHLILAKNRLSVIEQPYEIEKTLKAKDIVGKYYKPLYSFIPTDQNAFYVTEADFVTDGDGTGVLHVAPAFGEDDFNLGRKLDLPVFHTINDAGRFVREVTQWAGRFVKEADDDIAAELFGRGLGYRYGRIKHTYPFCWRCESPLLNYAMKTWYVRVTDLKERLIENNNKIGWTPSHIQSGRFGKWLETVRDWNISRNRYWGTPLPIWECMDCDKKVCIGSVEELKEHVLPIHQDKIDDLDLHRPYIDEIQLRCECGKPMQRVEEVMDCWFESGAMPYAQKHYPFEDKEQFEANFPAQFIAEGIDQTRGWFYTLHVLATILFDQPAFQNVIVNGIGLDEKGVKLSKRLRNYVEPEKLMDEVGADAMRYFFFAGTPMGEDWRFSDELVKEKMRKVLMLLWNSYVFFTTYAVIDGWKPTDVNAVPKSTNVLDQWVLSRLQSLIGGMSEAYETYDLTNVARPVEGFINELSTWYIRRSRRRFWKSESDADKDSAYQTLHHCLVKLAGLIAPMMPFVAEELYQNLVRTIDKNTPESIHHTDYPQVVAALVNIELEAHMALTMQIVETARSLRSENGLKVRQPLAELRVVSEKIDLVHLDERLLDIIQEEINVKAVVIDSAMPGHFLQKTVGEVGVGLDPTLTAELRHEGIARDLVRQIQSARKEAGFDIEDRIRVHLQFDDKEIGAGLTSWLDYAKQETLADEIVQNAEIKGVPDHQSTCKVNGVEVLVALKKVGGGSLG